MYEEEYLCLYCNGSGEGMYDGTRCVSCNGSGTEPGEEAEAERDDYDTWCEAQADAARDERAEAYFRGEDNADD